MDLLHFWMKVALSANRKRAGIGIRAAKASARSSSCSSSGFSDEAEHRDLAAQASARTSSCSSSGGLQTKPGIGIHSLMLLLKNSPIKQLYLIASRIDR